MYIKLSTIPRPWKKLFTNSMTKAYFSFQSAPSKDAGCTSNDDCPSTETCRNHNCVNPCSNGSPCARTAECLAQNHRAICSCPAGLIGDPFTNCFAEQIVVKPECRSDSECSSTQSCINERCQNPCADRNPCAGNAECRVAQHRPLCSCPAGWGGDPQVQCYKRECRFWRRVSSIFFN